MDYANDLVVQWQVLAGIGEEWGIVQGSNPINVIQKK